MSQIKLCVFDVDGTLPMVNAGCIDKEGIARISAMLQNNQIMKTAATGCGHLRMSLLFNGMKFVSPEAPLILENGSRIVQMDGTVLLEHPMDEDEVEFLIETMENQLHLLDFASFFPTALDKARFLLWSEEGRRLAQGGFVGGKTVDPDKFYEWIRSESRLTHVLLRSMQMLALNGLQAEPGGLFSNVTTKGIDKCSGVKTVLNLLGIAPDEAVFAGNDCNDRSVFMSKDLSGMKRIVVGDSISLCDVPANVRVPDPSKLENALFDIIYCGD